MARALTTGLKNQVTASFLRPFMLIEAQFDSGYLNVWSGIGDLSWDSKTWTGGANVISIGKITETEELKAAGVEIGLDGVSTTLIALSLTEDYQGRVCEIYIGAFDSNGAIVVDPYVIFSGFIDVIVSSEDGNTATFLMSVENKLIALERINKQLWTTERQKVDYPNDKGFDYVIELQNTDVVWRIT